MFLYENGQWLAKSSCLPAYTKQGKEAPAYNWAYMITRLSYRLQEIAYGGLSHLARATMQQVLADNGYDENGFEPTTRRRYRKNRLNLAGGTTLIREWRGKRYQVTVAEGGSDYEGKLYRSLTGVAKAIIGTHWSGRVFFGVQLNILLSFAEFERAIIAERVHDKIAGAKRKGKFCDGTPVFGYDVERNTHRLIVNEQKGRIYRYYVYTKAIKNGYSACRVRSVDAARIEEQYCRKLI